MLSTALQPSPTAVSAVAVASASPGRGLPSCRLPLSVQTPNSVSWVRRSSSSRTGFHPTRKAPGPFVTEMKAEGRIECRQQGRTVL